MTVLVLPLIFVFTALTVLVFAFGARRLLGLRFSFLRTLIAGVLAFLIASPIITAISGSVVAKRTSVLPELWFVILGVTIALVVGMVFLVVAEALVPSGSVPGLVYVLRGMRRRMGRARRYWQISGILAGTFHADPHPGNVLLLADGRLGLLDFGSVGRIDQGLRSALQRLLLALDRGDPAGLADALLEVVERPEELDELRLERMLGRFLARHVAAGITPDVTMFTDLFRIVSDHGLAVPPEIAAVFRALATMEGTLTQLAPGFDIVAEARRFAGQQLAGQFRPDTLRTTAADELVALLPLLRRLPRRVDRIGGALEAGRLSVNVRLLADEGDRRIVTGLLYLVLTTFLAATSGIMAVLMLGLRGGPTITSRVSLFQFLGYCLLVISAILALRVLALVFRPNRA